MSRNPFTKEPNPFEDPSVTGHTEGEGNADVVAAPEGVGAWGTVENSAWSADPVQATVTVTVPKGAGPAENGSATQKNDIAAKGQKTDPDSKPPKTGEMTQQAAIRVKNFPRCYPIAYHDIGAEIPQHLQFFVRLAFYAYLLFVGTLSWNFFAVLSTIGTDEFSVVNVFCSGVYLVAGIPASWVLWYRRVYHAAARDRSLNYMCFFLSGILHIAYCSWGAIAPQIGLTGGSSFAGLFTMVVMFDESKYHGILFLVGTFLWGASALAGIWMWIQTMRTFRNKGGVVKSNVGAAKTTDSGKEISPDGRV